MSDEKEKLLPGTAITYLENGEKGFARIEMLLEATGGLSLSQVCAVTGLEPSTIQNWVKRGWVSHPKGKRYEEIHIARILIINALKECIKLEHIALLMDYVNGAPAMAGGGNIKEAELFNFLCEALQKSGQADDLSRSGVESVVENVIKNYHGPAPDSRTRIRKALTLMIYACVCMDVKRRTEAMMKQILFDIENPGSIAAETADVVIFEKHEDVPEPAAVVRKTVSQAIREWDLSSFEKIISEHDAEDNATDSGTEPVPEEEDKPSYRPWYFKKNNK